MAKTKTVPDLNQLIDDASEAPSADLTPTDPTRQQQVVVTLDDLISCPFNPRTQKNAKYDQIKHSIRNRGLDHAPNITREKPIDPYMIKDGGNTRLSILKELWEETRDEQFYTLACTFHPWQGATDLLIGHLVENDLRGDTLFIERAVAAVQLKQFLENESGETLSIRGAAAAFTERGWSMDHGNLSTLFYAHDKLFPAIPNVFWAGMGTDKVKALRRHYLAFKKYCESIDFAEPELEHIWQDVLREFDGDKLNLEAIVQATNNALAHQIGTLGHLINGEITAILRGGQPSGRVVTRTEMEDKVRNPPDTDPAQKTANTTGTVATAHDNQTGTATTSPGKDPTLEQPTSSSPGAAATVSEPTLTSVAQEALFDWTLAQRQAIFDLSQSLLQDLSLPPESIVHTPHINFGYGLSLDIIKINTSNYSELHRVYLLYLYYLSTSYTQLNNDGSVTAHPQYPALITAIIGSDLNEPYLAARIPMCRTSPMADLLTTNSLCTQLENAVISLRHHVAQTTAGNDTVLLMQDLWINEETLCAYLKQH